MKGKEIIKKLEFFKEENKPIHISCGQRFYNGKIFYINYEKELLVLIDNKVGEVPILFEEILIVESFKEVEE